MNAWPVSAGFAVMLKLKFLTNEILLKKPNLCVSDLEILTELQKIYGTPRTELTYFTPFQLLSSVILSAQCTDKVVNRVMIPYYQQGFSPQTCLDWGEDKIRTAIAQIGLARSKARYLFLTAHTIQNDHMGIVPNQIDLLTALPGVGRKTAHVVLSELYHQDLLAVDTHVFRVAKRLGWHQERQDVQKAEAAIDRRFRHKVFLPLLHHLLILHGRRVCQARRPQCQQCAVRTYCPRVGVAGVALGAQSDHWSVIKEPR